jgi:hypothetical protein
MKLTYLLIAVLCLSTVLAVQDISVESGEPFVIESRLGPGRYTELSADYSIDEINFHHRDTVTRPEEPVIASELAIQAPEGSYIMQVSIYANKGFVRTDEVVVTIVGTTTEKNNRTNRTRPQEPVQPVSKFSVTIPPITDLTPGSVFVMPVQIKGNGTLQLEIPRLPFGTYEVPGPVTVENELTVPVLIRIDQKAEPGTYAIPVTAGDATTSARVRIIKYKQTDYSWMLIPLGIILLLIGLFVLFNRRRGGPELPPPQRPKEDGELITYY